MVQGFNLVFVTTVWSQKVARNRESKSTARLFHAKARRREGWRASVPTSRLLLCGRMVSLRSAGSKRLACPAAHAPPT